MYIYIYIYIYPFYSLSYRSAAPRAGSDVSRVLFVLYYFRAIICIICIICITCIICIICIVFFSCYYFRVLFVFTFSPAVYYFRVDFNVFMFWHSCSIHAGSSSVYMFNTRRIQQCIICLKFVQLRAQDLTFRIYIYIYV